MKKYLFRTLALLLILVSVFALCGNALAADIAPSNTNVVNIKNFGAKGDGSANDSTAFVNALNMAQKKNIPLYIPTGTYNLNNLIIWSTSTNVQIYGDGADRSVISNAKELHFNYNVKLSDFSSINTKGYCFYFAPKVDCTINISNVNCTGDPAVSDTGFLYSTAVYNHSISSATINNCKASNVARAVNLTTNVNNAAITNCDFENLGSQTASYILGIALGAEDKTTANNILVSNNTVKNLYTAVSGADYASFRRAYGILVYGQNVEISGNYVENIIGGEAHSGIYTKSPNAKILNNKIINAGDGGGCIINKFSNTTDYVVSGNYVYVDKAPAGTGSFNGIFFAGTNMTVDGNTIQMMTGGIAMNVNRWNAAGNVNSAVFTNNNITIIGQAVLYMTTSNIGPITISNNIIKQENNAPVANASVFTISSAGSTCKIDLSKNTVTATHAMLFNSWNCSSAATVSLSTNTFNTISDNHGSNYMYFSGMQVKNI